MKRLLVFGAAACLLALASRLPAEEKLKESPYFPLKVDTKWSYQITAGGQKKSATVAVVKHEKVGKTMCALLETTRDGKVVAKEHVAVQDDGIYRYSIGGEEINPPVCFLKLPPKKGETWKVEFKAGDTSGKATFTGGEAEITVPAGKYKTVTAVTSDFEVGSEKVPVSYWFAEKAGIVKQVLKFGGQEIVIELTKITLPK